MIKVYKSFSFFLFSINILFSYSVTDDMVNEATQDNSTLFSEIQLTGDIDESSSNGTSLDTDFRLSRLRRSTMIGRNSSANLPTRANSVASIEKVIIENIFYYIKILF